MWLVWFFDFAISRREQSRQNPTNFAKNWLVQRHFNTLITEPLKVNNWRLRWLIEAKILPGLFNQVKTVFSGGEGEEERGGTRPKRSLGSSFPVCQKHEITVTTKKRAWVTIWATMPTQSGIKHSLHVVISEFYILRRKGNSWSAN